MVAKATFENSQCHGKLSEAKIPGRIKCTGKEIDIAKELPLFVEAAELLYVPQPDKKTASSSNLTLTSN